MCMIALVVKREGFYSIKSTKIIRTRCVCETKMPPIMANSKDGQVHKDKYLNTSTKILSQEMLICNKKTLIFIILLLIMHIFSKHVKVISKVKIFQK